MSAHLDSTYGAAFTGIVVAAVLYGVSCFQTLYYFGTYQEDTWHIKLIVTAAMIFETVHQALITHTVYTYAITDWGNTDEIQLTVWSLLIGIILTGITAFIVQSFLMLRIWRLSSQNIYLTGTSSVLVIGGLASHFIYAAKAFQLKTLASFAKIRAKIRAESISINVMGAAADLLIAVTLCVLLNRSCTRFHKSDTILNKLILFTVTTGLLTSLCALTSLICILAAGNTFVYILFFFGMSRLYTNTLLATLNARKTIQLGSNEAGKVDTTSVSLRNFHKNFKATQRQGISIKIETTKECHGQKEHDESPLEGGV